ncbi:M15 family metallopeptidase [Paenibacillus lactis]|uniref:D-alanyl-D-alanine carboxypeptidase n=1 Tax=Paenibacillus lactis TaxID=228574 RepID=A0ABS4F5X5_9BACL|nr:M15 family metallopeptidase [Paenibacillus lactis]MBP1891654.1 D-alanyl-D-alanine carboxypeptidase [Paenibacillus lactis]GIO88898.1 putative carboxypeptidase YodJ [Paenibacillus lactis]HAG00343.1 peptidase M15 [Paenibacillus lactis]
MGKDEAAMNAFYGKRIRWTSLMLSSLLVAGSILAGCQSNDAGSGKEQGQELQSPAEGQEGTTLPEGTGEGASAEAGNEPADPVMAKRSENALQATVQEENGKQVVTNPDAVTVVVNKQRSLPDGYEPNDLVEPNVPFSFDGPHEKRMLRQEAAKALEELFAAAEADGMELRAVSGYRSYDRQKVIYENNVRTKGEAEANRVSAVPGTSEHQTGLTIDVSSPSAGNALEEAFGHTEEGEWLARRAPEFGFIIRYPEGAEDITGYVYEPWHIRYVGKDLAPDIAKNGLTLEEYFDEANLKL